MNKLKTTLRLPFQKFHSGFLILMLFTISFLSSCDNLTSLIPQTTQDGNSPSNQASDSDDENTQPEEIPISDHVAVTIEIPEGGATFWFLLKGGIRDIDYGDGQTTESISITGLWDDMAFHDYTEAGTYTLTFKNDNCLEFAIYSQYDIFQVTDIQGLDHLDMLTYLDLSYNYFTNFTSALPDSLLTLELAGNFLTDFSASFSSSNSLTYLGLSGNQLTSFTSALPDSLETLDLSGNQLTSVSASLNSSLKYLSIGSNQLTSLESTLPSSLESLYLSGNLFTDFDKSLPNSLTHLYLDNNQLTNFSAELPDSLTHLYLQQNQFETFSKELPDSLNSLYLNNNALTEFEETLPESLAYLYLENNSITSFDLNLPDSLVQLHLQNNDLTSFTSNLNEGLTNLNLSNNNLDTSTVSAVLAQLEGISPSSGTYNLRYQSPLAPPDAQGEIDRQTLRTAGNTVNTDYGPVIATVEIPPGGGTLLFYLNGSIQQIDFGDGQTQASASGNSLYSSPPISHAYSTSGTYTVQFTENGCTGFSLKNYVTDIAEVDQFPALTHLVLGNNLLTSFSTELPSTLLQLHLTNNQISNFTSVLPEGLQVLRLDNNSLTSFDLALPTSLADLSVGTNQLTSFTSDITHVESLTLLGNQLTEFTPELPDGLEFLSLAFNDIASFDHVIPDSLWSLQLQGNELTSFTTTIPPTLTEMWLKWNKLPSSTINSVLSQLVSNDPPHGTYKLESQSPAAPPTGQGITDKATLQGNGISISTD